MTVLILISRLALPGRPEPGMRVRMVPGCPSGCQSGNTHSGTVVARSRGRLLSPDSVQYRRLESNSAITSNRGIFAQQSLFIANRHVIVYNATKTNQAELGCCPSEWVVSSQVPAVKCRLSLSQPFISQVFHGFPVRDLVGWLWFLLSSSYAGHLWCPNAIVSINSSRPIAK